MLDYCRRQSEGVIEVEKLQILKSIRRDSCGNPSLGYSIPIKIILQVEYKFLGFVRIFDSYNSIWHQIGSINFVLRYNLDF